MWLKPHNKSLVEDKDGLFDCLPNYSPPSIFYLNQLFMNRDWPLWEVFIRNKQGLDHKHAGSLHASDAQMAIENARDVYTRRTEGVSIWVVESKYIHASNPDEAKSFYDPATDKAYRHPTFYELPDGVEHI